MEERLPALGSHSQIRIVKYRYSGGTWSPGCDPWPFCTPVLYSIDVEPGTYSIKVWIDGGYIKIAYKKGMGGWNFLYSHQLSVSNPEVWAEKCNVRLESIGNGPNPGNPIPETQTEVLMRYLLIGGGLLVAVLIPVLVLTRRRR